MIHQGIKDQVQYKVTEMQENVVEMGYVIYKSFDVISFITTVVSILPLISCGEWGNSVLPSALQKG